MHTDRRRAFATIFTAAATLGAACILAACTPAPPPGTSHSPSGYLDVLFATDTGIRVAGWASDWDTTDPIHVAVTVDGTWVVTLADGGRTDVDAMFHRGADYGYDIILPTANTHQVVCVAALNVGHGHNTLLGCGTPTPADPSATAPSGPTTTPPSDATSTIPAPVSTTSTTTTSTTTNSTTTSTTTTTTTSLPPADCSVPPGPGVDLHGCNLSGRNLALADLSGANFSRAILIGTNLPFANLTTTNFTGADLTNARLDLATMASTNFTNATLTGADIGNATLTNADFAGANLTNATFFLASLNGVNFTNANLTGASFSTTTRSGLTWNNTTCPNGTNSDVNAACVGQGGGL